MQVKTAIHLVCLVIILIGIGIAVYGDYKNELFCLVTGSAIMAIGLGFTIYVSFL